MQWLAILIVGVFVAAPGSPASGQIEGVERVQRIARLTGEGAINDTGAVCVGGTDLGILVEHEGRVWAYFGDSFSGPTPSKGGDWRNNLACWSTDDSPADGLSIDGWVTDDDGCARQVVVDPAPNQVTIIPTGGVSANGKVYLWCMSVRRWGEPGKWWLNHARLFRSEDGREFERVPGFEWPGDSRFGMCAAALGSWADPEDEHVYLLGTPGGRFGGVSVARVPVSRVEDPSAYEYFAGVDENGKPAWSDSEGDAAQVVPPTVGELSIFYAEAAERWVTLSFNHNEARVELRHSERPWGPWSEPMTVASGADYPMLYGSYTCPCFVLDGGRTVYFTMSMWEPYDVFWMRVDLRITDRAVDARDADAGTPGP